MKILQVTDTFVPSDFGGVKVVSYNISKALAKKGYEIVVYTTDANVGHSRLRMAQHEKKMDGFYVRYFKNISNLLAFKYRIFLPLGVIPALKKEIRHFDIIHLHNFRTVQNIIVHHYAQKHGIPYVLQAHGSVLPFFAKQRFKNLYDKVWGYKILKDATKVIALTKTEAEQYKKMEVDENKIVIVPNGIVLSEYENLPDREAFRKKYGIKDDEKVILYIGRLHKTKGIDLLVKAFSDISKESNNVKLLIVGPDDGYQSALEELTKTLKVDDNVLFTGFVTDDEKIAALVNADVFVTPSYSGFPVTFLEACTCGTPIITTNNGDKLDWIHGKVGYVVEYDKGQLRTAIFTVLNDEELRRRFGEEGKRLVREEYGWDIIVTKVEKVYKSMKQ